MPEPPALLTPEDWVVINNQRVITAAINNDVVKVGAIYLRPTSKIPAADDWFKQQYRDTDIGRPWIDNENLRYANVGFNLQQGWVDVDIDGDDNDYNKCIHAAMVAVGVDCRLAFGRKSAGTPRHLLVQLPEEEISSFEELRRFQPAEISVKAQRFRTEIRSGSDKSTDARQTVVPGSMYGDGTGFDISVWWDGQGRVAKSVSEFIQTTPRIVNFNQLIRAIAFGTIAYLIKPFWTVGTRQSTALKFNGWLARIVDESFAMNNGEMLQKDVFCPIDTDDIAEALIEFICAQTGDEEAYMRKRAFKDAREKLARNPDAKVPGWTSIRELLGEEIMLALKSVCNLGAETSALSIFAERYVYEESGGDYIDRDRHRQGEEKFIHAAEDLIRRHKELTIKLGPKSKPQDAFIAFEKSRLRKKVGSYDLFPMKPAGQMFRMSRSQGIVPDEFEGDDSHLVFNSWRDWDVQPTQHVNPQLMKECEAYLSQLLNYISCDRKEQQHWLKSWFAWIIQHPGEKQQIAAVLVGSQGTGKSFFGNIFCKAMLGSSHGLVSGKIIGERFSISPFINKMLVFLDEVKYSNKGAIDETKLLIRNIKMHGELKGKDSRDYNNFARLIFASNNLDVRLGESNTIDRALFFIRCYNPEFMELSPTAFLEWTYTLKPFFDQFALFLQRHDVIAHYMRMFVDMQVDRHEIEDIKWSSSHDHDIMRHNLSAPRRFAKMLVESGKMGEFDDLTAPFADTEFEIKVADFMKKIGDNSTAPRYILEEFKRLGMLEYVRIRGANLARFRWNIGTLTEKFGEAIGMKLDSQLEFGPGDFGDNINDGTKKGRFRGKF